MKKKKIKAWHFLPEDRRLKHKDGRLVEVGKTYSCVGDVRLCHNGMHGSERISHAIKYMTGPILCRVEIEGDLHTDYDKVAGKKRTVLAMEDISRSIHIFAVNFAERSISLIDDYFKGREYEKNEIESLRNTLEVKKLWMKGEVSDTDIDEVYSEAWRKSFSDILIRIASQSVSWSVSRNPTSAIFAIQDSLNLAVRISKSESDYKNLKGSKLRAFIEKTREEEQARQDKFMLDLLKENHPNLCV